MALLFAGIQKACAQAWAYSYQYPAPNSGLGKIAGQIRGDLKPLRGVRVVLLKDDEPVDEKITDEYGCFMFVYLTPGCYDIKGCKDGFRTHLITHVPAYADRTTPADFYMPKYNRCNMPACPIVEAYKYPKKWVKDLMREDYSILINAPLPRNDD
jgi:hypothetical protein